LETANGYQLTTDGMIMAVKFLLEHASAGGYYTPSMLMGARCVEHLPGSTLIRVDLSRSAQHVGEPKWLVRVPLDRE
jgi:short subunit dehydrogenase-like uncharacterized protein